MRNPFLIGSKVYLRPLDLEDVPVLTTWLNDPEVRRHLLIHRPLSRMAEETFLRKLSESESEFVLGIVVREPEQFIGVTGLRHIDVRNRHAEFGIAIGEKTAWGSGYGTEATRLIVRYAFETLNFNRIWLHVGEDNERAVRVYEKVGFRTEGRLRQDMFRDGRYWDSLVMAVLRDDLRAANQGEGG
ncbi:MAG TPA: GNAT family protein [Gemmataceae bacterium]|jgi:RimJ/RimL family protein N-acetyltransferase